MRAILATTSWIFYLLAFFAFLFSLVWPRPLLHTVGFLLLMFGFLPHLIALVLRTIIMSRPPVTNLYETFVFVGVVTVLLSLLTEVFNKKWLGIVVGSICGFIFLAIADKFRLTSFPKTPSSAQSPKSREYSDTLNLKVLYFLV